MVAERLQDELDGLAVRLGRSLTVDGVDGELLAYSAQRDDTDPVRISSILLRHVSPEIRAWEQRHVGPETADPVHVPANPELGMSARIGVPLRCRGTTLGLLWMIDPGVPLHPDDQRTLVRAATTLADHLSSSTGNAPSGRESDRLLRRVFDTGEAAAGDQLALAVPGLVDGVVQVVAAVASVGPGVRPFQPPEFSSLTRSLTPILRASTGYVGSCVSSACGVVVLHHRRPMARNAAQAGLASAKATTAAPVTDGDASLAD